MPQGARFYHGPLSPVGRGWDGKGSRGALARCGCVRHGHLPDVVLTLPAATAHYLAGRDGVVRTHNGTAHP
jgi:hypothetical protein